MERKMEHPVNRYITAGSIISSLGFGAEDNFSRIREYRSGIVQIDDDALFDVPFMAARIDDARLREAVSARKLDGYTLMEQLFILSLSDTIRQSGVDPAGPDCGLIISTTKGNIDMLSGSQDEPLIPVGITPSSRSESSPYPGRDNHLIPESTSLSCREGASCRLFEMAKRVADYWGCVNEPIVISNACISGVSALVVASRLIEAGKYKHILVAGGDLLTCFVITGFQSFKSVSPGICKPYDETRDGLSLGEACGAVLVTSDRQLVKEDRPVRIEGGAITNDANHISGPSRTGDGLYYAISQAMEEASAQPEDISFVNAHGTATLYNDEMESKALHLAGLDRLPLNSMKSYWGHTLGASGVIETIACMEELRSGEVFGTLGYTRCGVLYPLSVSSMHRRVEMGRCVKTASGFGGCNAAVVLSVGREREEDNTPPAPSREGRRYSRRTVEIGHGRIVLDGEVLLEAGVEEDFATFIRTAYKLLLLDDRKFYKMDDLCKLGYIAAACLFSKNGGTTGYAPGEVGMIFANASSSLDTDRKHQHIIDTLGDQGASPAVFVYTLPNVVMGELCIRYKIQGENTFFINSRYPESFIREYAGLVMQKQKLRACLTGWCELLGAEYEARFDWLEEVADSNE